MISNIPEEFKDVCGRTSINQERKGHRKKTQIRGVFAGFREKFGDEKGFSEAVISALGNLFSFIPVGNHLSGWISIRLRNATGKLTFYNEFSLKWNLTFHFSHFTV